MNYGRILVTAIILTLITGSGVLIMALTNENNKQDQTEQVNASNVPEIDLNVPSELETASFGLGCFWEQRHHSVLLKGFTGQELATQVGLRRTLPIIILEIILKRYR